jgi:hypothetical protein
MSAGHLVRSVLWITFPVVRAAARDLWSAPGLRERYPVYLAAMYGVIRSSVPLMRTAVDACAVLDVGDRSAEPLTRYLAAHIEEERGHDRWLLEDLAVLGIERPESLLGHAVQEDVAALVGAQYYWTLHVHPACLLGYMAVLEGCSPHAETTRRLPGMTGWPPAAFRTVASHASMDPGHLSDLTSLLDRLPLSGAVGEAVARTAAFTAMRSAELLRRLRGDDAEASHDL